MADSGLHQFRGRLFCSTFQTEKQKSEDSCVSLIIIENGTIGNGAIFVLLFVLIALDTYAY